MARPPQLVHVARQAAGRADHHRIRVALLIDRADQRALIGQPALSRVDVVVALDLGLPFIVQALRLGDILVAVAVAV